MNNKIITGGVIGAILILLFFWTVVFIENRPIKVVENTAPTVVTPVDNSHATYQDSAGKFSLSYPNDFTVEASSTNSLFAQGVSFIVPETMATGTNLSKDSRVYVEVKSASSTCTANTFAGNNAPSNAKVQNITIGSTTYSTLNFSDAGAGNFYDTTIYATKGALGCYGIELFIHSTNIGNYDPGTIQEFDKAKLLSIFSDILASFKVK